MMNHMTINDVGFTEVYGKYDGSDFQTFFYTAIVYCPVTFIMNSTLIFAKKIPYIGLLFTMIALTRGTDLHNTVVLSTVSSVVNDISLRVRLRNFVTPYKLMKLEIRHTSRPNSCMIQGQNMGRKCLSKYMYLW